MTTDARRAELGAMNSEAFAAELAKYGCGYGPKSHRLVEEAVRRLRLDAEAESRGIAKGRAEAFEAGWRARHRNNRRDLSRYDAMHGDYEEYLRVCALAASTLAQADAKKGDGR